MAENVTFGASHTHEEPTYNNCSEEAAQLRESAQRDAATSSATLNWTRARRAAVLAVQGAGIGQRGGGEGGGALGRSGRAQPYLGHSLI